MSIDDNVFDLMNALAEEQRAQEMRRHLAELDEWERQFIAGMVFYAMAVPERFNAVFGGSEATDGKP